MEINNLQDQLTVIISNIMDRRMKKDYVQSGDLDIERHANQCKVPMSSYQKEKCLHWEAEES